MGRTRQPDVPMVDLVFDIGGTIWRAALYGAGGLEQRKQIEARPGADPVVALLDGLTELGRAVLGEVERPGRIAIAFPGPVDGHGRVQAAPPLWERPLERPLDLGRLVAAMFGDAPVTVVNDLSAAGYRYLGDGGDFAVITVSTGIGSKVFVEGRPLLGSKQRGGEIGHWRVDMAADAPPCDCGGRGHLGAIASGRALPAALARARSEHPDLLESSALRAELSRGATPSNRDVARAFREADGLAVQAVAYGARALGSALALLHVGIGLERFVIIGGLARALGDEYLHLLERAAAAACWGDPEDWAERIQPGEPDDDSGLLGAGRLLEAQVVRT